MDNAQIWRTFFEEWPPGLPTRGVLVTTYGDQIPFVGYYTTDSLVIVERQTPDSMGGRQVILVYGSIDAIKVTDPIESNVFTDAGFQAAAGASKRKSNETS